MNQLVLMSDLSRKTDSKIVLIVMDGLGGLPSAALGGKTELEAAKTPNLDALAKTSALGTHKPIMNGVAPGSGPAHLAVFGYDPLKWNMGRGVLETLGIGFDLKPGDVAIRTNFCTLDAEGKITDRRAGRIPTAKCDELCQLLDKKVKIEGVKTYIRAVRDYRGAVVFRGKGLGANIADTDPQVTGAKPLSAKALDSDSKKTAKLADELVKQAHKFLRGKEPANGFLLRGFSEYREYPTFEDVYKLNAACIAVYPMYKGVSRLVGMKLVDGCESFDDELAALEKCWKDHDFFFVHYKPTDSKGEDGDSAGKVSMIEKFDEKLGRVLALKPDVLVITGDHSTPTQMKSHSWHPVPFLLSGPNAVADANATFGEKSCSTGSIGQIPATSLMPLALAHAGKLLKFGA